MANIRDKSEYERKGTETTTFPSQYDNKDYGKKRKAKTKTLPIKNTTTGQVYGYKTIEEMKFSDFLITEAEKKDDTRLPQSVIGEIVSLIKKGAKELHQAWKHAGELVNTAYHMANVRRPTPDQKGAWQQYEEMLKQGVRALADHKGLSGDWRLSKTAFAEELANTPELDQILTEAAGKRQHRIFARVQNIGYEDEEQEHEIAADDLNHVVQTFTAQAKRNGRKIHITPLAHNHMKLTVYIQGVNGTKDEQIIHIKDWSL